MEIYKDQDHSRPTTLLSESKVEYMSLKEIWTYKKKIHLLFAGIESIPQYPWPTNIEAKVEFKWELKLYFDYVHLA